MNSDEKTAVLSAAELAASFLAVIAVVSLLSCCISRRIITTRLPGVLLSDRVDRPITTATSVSSVGVAAEDDDDVEQNDAVEGTAKQLEAIGGRGGGGPGGTCSVCLGEYGANDVVRVLPGCGHAFHRTCVDSWLRVRPTCPLCRNEPCVVVSSSLHRIVPPPPG